MSDNDFSAGRRFGEYEIVRLIGRGGMNAVYEARHMTLKKRVALKAMFPDLAANPDMLARFMREGEAAGRIRHPHVVTVSDVGVVDGVPYLVMEYLEGEDFCNLLDAKKLLPVDQAIAILLPVISAVSAAHDAGVVHRDLKPENIFLTLRRNGELHPKVLDFGISKLVDNDPNAGVTKTMTVMGTPHYMSPEQAVSTKRVDARTDQYSLGVVLYEALTGVRPYDGDTLYDLLQSIVDGGAKPPSTHVPSLPKGLDDAILRAMNKDAAARFSSLVGFGHALLPFADPTTRARWSPEFEDAADNADSRTVFPGSDMLSDGGRIHTEPPPPSGPPVAHAPTELSRVEIDDESEVIGRSASLRTPRRAPVWLPFAVLAVCLLAVAAAYAIRSAPTPTRDDLPRDPPTSRASVPAAPAPVTELQSYALALVVHPSTAVIELDGQPAGSGSIAREFPRDGTSHQIHLTAPGYEPQTLAFRDSPPPPEIELAIIAPGVMDSGRGVAQGTGTAPAQGNPSTVGGAHPARNTVGAHATGGGHPAHDGTAATPSAGTNGAMILN